MRNPFGKNFNEIAQKLKNGDQKAAEEIFEYFNPKIFRYFMARVSSREIAEDLAQETLLKLIDKIDTFDHKLGNFSAWFWKIANNTLIDYYREKKAIPFSNLELAAENLIDKNYNLNPAAKERLEEVLKAVKNFSKEEQEIFSLHYLSDISYKDLSVITNKTEPYLRVIVHRINQKIKKTVL